MCFPLFNYYSTSTQQNIKYKNLNIMTLKNREYITIKDQEHLKRLHLYFHLEWAGRPSLEEVVGDYYLYDCKQIIKHSGGYTNSNLFSYSRFEDMSDYKEIKFLEED